MSEIKRLTEWADDFVFRIIDFSILTIYGNVTVLKKGVKGLILNLTIKIYHSESIYVNY